MSSYCFTAADNPTEAPRKEMKIQVYLDRYCEDSSMVSSR